MSDIDTAVVDSLKVIDLKWPIREADIRPLIVSGPAMATMQKLHLPPMPKRLLASVDGIGQRSLIVSAGAAVAGAVACLDTAPAPLATLIGVCGRRAMQNASTASVTAVLISA